MEKKQYYAHLFNDCISFSSKRMGGYFKLHTMFEFKNAIFTRHEKAGPNTFGFTIEPKDEPDKAEDFCIASEKDATEWFQIINDQIEMLKTKRIAKRSSAMHGGGKAAATIPGVQLAKLGKRCGCIYKFLIDEMQFADSMNALNITLVQPIINASKGAVLSAAMNLTDVGDTQYMDKNEELFDNRAATTTKYQTQLVTEALQEADVLIFLRAAEGLAIAVREFVKSLEQLCTKAAWDESMIIGPHFNSVSAISLYNQFKSYSAGQQAMVRVLRMPAFAQFHKDAENFLSSIPGSLQEKLELPRKRLSIYLHFMSQLSAVTPESHPDHYSVKSSLLAVEGTEKEIVELIKMKKNFETLLEIQASLVTIGRSDPVVQKLASMERTFITQGDLKKVCRKKNKMFRFWLFNDFLLYGESLGGEKFSFNRALELSKCTVAAHTTSELRNAIEIFGAEKSFIVIALTEAMFTNWLDALTNACAKAREANGTNAVAAAPLWTPDHNSANCPLCNKVRAIRSYHILFLFIICHND